MIDIHQHLIHGVDDGPKTFDQTQEMLRRAVAENVSEIVATPHAVPGQIHFDLSLYQAHLQMAQEWCADNRLQLTVYPGAEVFYTDSTVRMLDERRIPTLNQTRCVLLEFPYSAPYEKLIAAAGTLTEADYLPVFAHVERYACLRNTAHLRKLREKYGVLMQMNANTVLNAGGFLRRMWCKNVLKQGYIDVISSDAHSIHSRPCRMGAAYEELVHICGKNTAQDLCIKNPNSIIHNLL